MEHQDLTTSPLAGIVASARRIALGTLAFLAVAAVLSGAAYAVGRWL